MLFSLFSTKTPLVFRSEGMVGRMSRHWILSLASGGMAGALEAVSVGDGVGTDVGEAGVADGVAAVQPGSRRKNTRTGIEVFIVSKLPNF